MLALQESLDLVRGYEDVPQGAAGTDESSFDESSNGDWFYPERRCCFVDFISAARHKADCCR